MIPFQGRAALAGSSSPRSPTVMAVAIAALGASTRLGGCRQRELHAHAPRRRFDTFTANPTTAQKAG